MMDVLVTFSFYFYDRQMKIFIVDFSAIVHPAEHVIVPSTLLG